MRHSTQKAILEQSAVLEKFIHTYQTLEQIDPDLPRYYQLVFLAANATTRYLILPDRAALQLLGWNSSKKITRLKAALINLGFLAIPARFQDGSRYQVLRLNPVEKTQLNQGRTIDELKDIARTPMSGSADDIYTVDGLACWRETQRSNAPRKPYTKKSPRIQFALKELFEKQRLINEIDEAGPKIDEGSAIINPGCGRRDYLTTEELEMKRVKYKPEWNATTIRRLSLLSRTVDLILMSRSVLKSQSSRINSKRSTLPVCSHRNKEIPADFSHDRRISPKIVNSLIAGIDLYTPQARDEHSAVLFIMESYNQFAAKHPRLRGRKITKAEREGYGYGWLYNRIHEFVISNCWDGRDSFDFEDWELALKRIANNDFLLGNKIDWCVTLEWLFSFDRRIVDLDNWDNPAPFGEYPPLNVDRIVYDNGDRELPSRWYVRSDRVPFESILFPDSPESQPVAAPLTATDIIGVCLGTANRTRQIRVLNNLDTKAAMAQHEWMY